MSKAKQQDTIIDIKYPFKVILWKTKNRHAVSKSVKITGSDCNRLNSAQRCLDKNKVVCTLLSDINKAITAINAAPCILVTLRKDKMRNAETLINIDHNAAGTTNASNFNLGMRKMQDCPPIILEKKTTKVIVVNMIEAIPFAFGPRYRATIKTNKKLAIVEASRTNEV